MMLTMPDNLIELREKYHIKHVPFYKSCSLKALAIHMCLHSKHVGFVKEALGTAKDPDAFVRQFLIPGNSLKIQQGKRKNY